MLKKNHNNYSTKWTVTTIIQTNYLIVKCVKAIMVVELFRIFSNTSKSMSSVVGWRFGLIAESISGATVAGNRVVTGVSWLYCPMHSVSIGPSTVVLKTDSATSPDRRPKIEDAYENIPNNYLTVFQSYSFITDRLLAVRWSEPRVVPVAGQQPCAISRDVLWNRSGILLRCTKARRRRSAYRVRTAGTKPVFSTVVFAGFARERAGTGTFWLVAASTAYSVRRTNTRFTRMNTTGTAALGDGGRAVINYY